MSIAPDNVRLSENHRRVVSVLLRGLEQMCDEIEEWLDKQSGLLFQVQDDLSPKQRAALTALTKEVRREIQRLAGELDIGATARSVKARVRALLSANLVNLEESDSSRLRGYGHLPEETKKKLDAEVSRLIAVIERMIRVVENT